MQQNQQKVWWIALAVVMVFLITFGIITYLKVRSISNLQNGAKDNNVSADHQTGKLETPVIVEAKPTPIDGQWTVASYTKSGEAKKIDGYKWTVSTASGNLSAKFCNTITGVFTTNAAMIRAGQMAATLMACKEPVVTAAESDFIEIMAAGANYTLANGEFTITNGATTFVLKSVATKTEGVSPVTPTTPTK